MVEDCTVFESIVTAEEEDCCELVSEAVVVLDKLISEVVDENTGGITVVDCDVVSV